MKELLFATTAIVAAGGFAGAAMAEVNLSGSAEMGIFYVDLDSDGDDDDDGNIEFHTDIDVTFTLAGATDSGLVFGASIDLDESDGSNVGEDDDNDVETNPVVFRDLDGDGLIDDGEIAFDFEGEDEDGDITLVPGTGAGSFLASATGASPAFDNNTQGGEEIFISGGFGRLTMGDTDGALDWALAEVGFNATAINDDHEHEGWSGNSGLDGTYDGQILRYDYTFGDFGIAVSGEVSDDDDDSDDPVLGIGFRGSIDFAGNAIGFGLGYQNRDDDDAYGVSVNGTIAGFQVGLTYTDVDQNNFTAGQTFGVDGDDDDGDADDSFTISEADDDDFQHYGIGAGYNAGALSLHANYGIYDFDDGDENMGFGVTAGYELGDGIELQVGYGYSEIETDGVATRTGSGTADDPFEITDADDGEDERHQFSFGVAMNF